MTDSMIERMALALEAEFNGYRAGAAILIDASQTRDSFRKAARATLLAMREPTNDIALAAVGSLIRHGYDTARVETTAAIWRDMIDAALAKNVR